MNDRRDQQSDDHLDPWLEASLEELYGGRVPPDLTEEILAQLESAGTGGGSGELGPQPAVVDQAARRRRGTWSRTLLALAMALAVAVTIWSFWPQWIGPAGRENLTVDRVGNSGASSGGGAVDSVRVSESPESDGSAERRDSNSAAELAEQQPSEVGDRDERIVWRPGDPLPWENDEPGSKAAQRGLLETLEPTRIVAHVDQHFARLWSDSGVAAARAIADRQWLERTCAGLFGAMPTSDQQALLDEYRDRERVVGALLAEPYREQWIRHWAAVWTDALWAAPAETSTAELRERLEGWIGEQLRAGEGLDRIFERLLVVQGSTDPAAADFDPAVAFLVGHRSRRSEKNSSATMRVTDVVSRVLLASRLDCARCHDHPMGSWSQDDYWHLDGMLREVQWQDLPERSGVRVADRTRASDNQSAVSGSTTSGSTNEPSDGYFERVDGTLVFALPALTVWGGGPVVTNDAPLRKQLARWLVTNDQLSVAVANRIWSRLFGVGLATPIDSLGPHAPTPHEPLLQLLAEQVRAHDYQLPDILEGIVLSGPFAAEVSPNPWQIHELVLFERFPRAPLQLPSAQATLDLLAGFSTGQTSLAQIERDGLPWLGQVLAANPSGQQDPGTQQTVELRQVLDWLRNQALEPRLDDTDLAWIRRLGRSDLDAGQLIDHAFWTLLRREPTTGERVDAMRLLAGRPREAALQQIWTALRSVAESSAFR